MNGYVPLDVRSSYSMGDSICQIPRLVRKAREMGFPALAIADRNCMYGIAEFHAACRSQRTSVYESLPPIKPIIGQATITTIHGENHLIRLLAKNNTGYRNLVRISSAEVQPKGSKGRTIPFSDIEKWSDGLICMTNETAPDFVNECLRVFGDDFAFMADNDDFDCSEWPSVMVCAANPVRFLENSDAEACEVCFALFDGKKWTDSNRRHCNGDEYLMSREEMSVRFPKHPEWIENTVKLAGRIEDYEICEAPEVPEFPIPQEFSDEADCLASLVYDGMKKRWGEPTPPEIVERIDFELHVIKMMGFPSYFLIVHDYVEAARRMGVWVGPARGSATGSAVAYALGITSVDPIKHRLLFERFLNPDRVSMPDIDIDFEDEGRGKVVEYLCEKYGRDHVAHIVTFGQMAPKSAIKDVSRVLEYPIRKANELAGLVPDEPRMTFSRALNGSAKFRQVYENGDETQKKILRIAERLEGCVRQPDLHASGIVISRRPLSETLPVMSLEENARRASEPELITQYDGHYVEPIGLVKFDILGLKTLAVQKYCVNLIKERKGQVVDLDKIPHDEPETMEVFAKGDTEHIFQFESDGMKRWLMALKPKCLDDLVAMNALYRPGPMAYVSTFVRRKNGEEPVTYDHPLMEEDLRETYGVTVYQEQIMILSRKLAGFTRGESDKLRKAMGKKHLGIMEELKGKFVEGCLANPEFRIDKWKDEDEARSLIDKIWDDWCAFAAYAFNKSHAVAYAWLAYQSAYLKAHYPEEFILAQLQCEYCNGWQIGILMEVARKSGVKLYDCIDADKLELKHLEEPPVLTVVDFHPSEEEAARARVLQRAIEYSQAGDDKCAVVYYSLAMPKSALWQRFPMSGAHMIFDDRSSLDVEVMCSEPREDIYQKLNAKYRRRIRVRLVVVDYLQLVNDSRFDSSADASEREEAILNRLLRFVFEACCHVIVLRRIQSNERR